jgi:glycosyltransferase involved in cell wall biosynthesis
VACILLWYPLFTQPFIFRETEGLKRHMPVAVYSLHSQSLRHCSREMQYAEGTVTTFGPKSVPALLLELFRLSLCRPRTLLRIYRRLLRPWRGLETFAENLWAMLVGIGLGRTLKESGIDVIYAPWPRGPATAAWAASTLSGIPFATSARGDNLEPADPDLAEKFQAALFVRANNAHDKERIESFANGEAAGKTYLIYNSLALPPPREEPRMRGPVDPVRLLALGRFDVTKGFDVLLQACNILKKQGLPFTLTLAGGGRTLTGIGSPTSKLLRMRRSFGLEDRVHMPGLLSHDELPILLESHDVFVAPCIVHNSGRRDGIPNPVIEAMAYGLPVVGTTAGAMTEIVRDGATGLTVEPKDPEALADAIRRLADDPHLARTLGANGKALVGAMFDPELNAERLAALFLATFLQEPLPCAA